MSMSKEDFIALADVIKRINRNRVPFTTEQIAALADFCASQNDLFKRERWLGYISGEVGSSGGTKKKTSKSGSGTVSREAMPRTCWHEVV